MSRQRTLAVGLVVAAGAISAACSARRRPEVPPAAPDTTTAAAADAGAATGALGGNDEKSEAEQIAAIEYAVNHGAQAVHNCYKRATAQHYDLSGKLILGVEFDENRFPVVEVLGNQTKSELLEECVAALYRQFPWPPVFAPGQQIQLPFSFVAPVGQYTVHREHVAARQVNDSLRATVLLDSESTGNGAAALTVLELAAGARVPLHKHTSAELMYVVSGDGTLFGARGSDKGVAVRAGSAIYIAAGVPHGFAAGEQASEVIQLYAPGGPEQRFEGADTGGTAPVSDAEARKSRRGPQPRVNSLADGKAFPIGGGQGNVAILFDADSAGDRAAYVGVLTAGPGMKVPEHVHAAETELLYVLSGEGVMTVSGVEQEVRPQTAIQVPPNTPHSFAVTSAEPVVAVQFYTPSGPEQRFKR